MSRVPDIKGRWAVVTGASSGIGLRFATELASMGCNVFAVSNQEHELGQTASALMKNFPGVKVGTLFLDLASEKAADAVVDALNERKIVPLLLINNAGIFDFRRVSHLSPRRLDLYIDLHIRAVTHLCRAVGGMMAENGGGYILNMSSMSCWMPMPGIAMYSATKAYIRAFSRALRIEVKELGVSVTVACPGGIATNLFGLPPKLQRLGVKLHALDTPQRFVKKALRRTLQGRAQYINGGLNRMAIVAVASLPEWARLIIKTRLLDRINQ